MTPRRHGPFLAPAGNAASDASHTVLVRVHDVPFSEVRDGHSKRGFLSV